MHQIGLFFPQIQLYLSQIWLYLSQIWLYLSQIGLYLSLIPLYLSKKNFNIDNDIEIDVDIDKYINICIDKYHNICIDNIIDIDIDTENFNTDASTVNSVHACLYHQKKCNNEFSVWFGAIMWAHKRKKHNSYFCYLLERTIWCYMILMILDICCSLCNQRYMF